MDPSQFEQIIVNLAVNARDAMPNGGALKITLYMEAPEQSTDDLPAVDSVIRLTVTDTGEGIDETVLPHIFEPFFTTKGPNAGTGLGLATVHGIVTQASGRIVVDSEKGRGTRVRITFPCCATKPNAAPTEAKTTPQQRSNYRVLVVEDQDSVRHLVTRSLQRFGFTPIAYANAQSALEFANVNGNAFDVVLTDVVMPGMNGRALADELRRRHPSLPIVFMSGHVDDGVLRQGVERNQEHYIAKPFSPVELANKLRSVLHST
jgi:CheY-like chemotaxis protein